MKRFYLFEGWAIPRPVLLALIVTAIVEFLELVAGFPVLFAVQWVNIVWTAIPCLVAGAFVLRSPHISGIKVSRERLISYLVLYALLIVFASKFVMDNGFAVTAAVFAAVSIEEVVYRLAIPLVVGLVFRYLGIESKLALIAGVVFAIVLFALMPGHQDQLDSSLSYVSFVAFSILMAHAVWRGKSLFAAVVAHAVYDFANLGMVSGDTSSMVRLLGGGVALLALAVIAAHPKIRIIDLRDPAGRAPNVGAESAEARSASVLSNSATGN